MSNWLFQHPKYYGEGLHQKLSGTDKLFNSFGIKRVLKSLYLGKVFGIPFGCTWRKVQYPIRWKVLYLSLNRGWDCTAHVLHLPEAQGGTQGDLHLTDLKKNTKNLWLLRKKNRLELLLSDIDPKVTYQVAIFCMMILKSQKIHSNEY